MNDDKKMPALLLAIVRVMQVLTLVAMVVTVFLPRDYSRDTYMLLFLFFSDYVIKTWKDE